MVFSLLLLVFIHSKHISLRVIHYESIMNIMNGIEYQNTNEKLQEFFTLKLTLIFTYIIFTGNCFTTSSQDYFQQEVNYSIDVTLNDSLHELKAFETIEYINNSPRYSPFPLFPFMAECVFKQ